MNNENEPDQPSLESRDSSDGDKADEPSLEALESERGLLEDLFSKRFSYYSLFAAGFILAVFQAAATEERLLRLVTATGWIVFGLMLLSIWRTNILINCVLDKLKNKSSTYPLNWLIEDRKKDRWKLLLKLPLRSNSYLVGISLSLWLLISVFAVLSWTDPEALKRDDRQQVGAADPATASESKLEKMEKPLPESERPAP